MPHPALIILALLSVAAIAAALWFIFESCWNRILFSAQPPNVARNLSATQANSLIQSTSNLVILDVRPHDKFHVGSLPNAKNIPLTLPLAKSNLDQLDKSLPYLVYCDGGFRSRVACSRMKKLGFRKIYNLHRGVLSWRLRRLPVVK